MCFLKIFISKFNVKNICIFGCYILLIYCSRCMSRNPFCNVYVVFWGRKGNIFFEVGSKYTNLSVPIVNFPTLCGTNVYSIVILPVTLFPDTAAFISFFGVYCSNSVGKSIIGSLMYFILPVPLIV